MSALVGCFGSLELAVYQQNTLQLTSNKQAKDC
jgi:hypothetical protein